MKPTRKWTVGLISTGTDLKNERTRLIKVLKDKGFEVIAYDSNHFPRDLTLDKNEGCLAAFDDIDIAMIIVANEAGTVDEEQIGIVQKEYDHVKSLEKSVFILVNRNVWLNYENAETKHAVRSAKLLDHINSDCKDFITPFDDINDLESKALGALVGYSKTLLRCLAESQYSKLSNTRVIPGLGYRVGEHTKHYTITPPVRPSVDSFGKKVEIQKLYKLFTQPGYIKRILIRGDIGSGKSTVLFMNYFAHFEEYLNKRETVIPLFLSMRRLQPDYNLDQYFADNFHKHFQKEIYPLFNHSLVSFALYVDGIDEMSIPSNHLKLEIFSNSLLEGHIFVTCRSPFYDAYLQDTDFLKGIDLDLQVSRWSKGLIKEYIDLIFSNEAAISDGIISDDLQAIPRENIQSIKKSLINWCQTNFVDWLQSPLMISIVCFSEISTYAQPRWGSVNNMREGTRDEYSLMYNYIRQYILRELIRIDERQAYGEKMVNQILNAIKQKGWEIYLSRLSSEDHMPKNDAPNDPIISEIVDSFFAITSYEGEFFYNTHEYFIDVAVAMYILDCMKQLTIHTDFLDFMLSANINKLILQRVNKSDFAERTRISENLFAEYHRVLFSNPQNVIRRTHIVYYLGRINLSKNKEKLKEILHSLEKEVEILLSICFGLIKLGDLEEENHLYSMVENNQEWDETNRGYHLLYYKDVQNREVPFRDDGTSDWSKTFYALKKHICYDNQYDNLARIDLQIMKKFCLSRSRSIEITEADINEMDQKILRKWQRNDLLGKRVLDEWRILKPLLKGM